MTKQEDKLKEEAGKIEESKRHDEVPEQTGSLALLEEARRLRDENLKLSQEIKQNLEIYEKLTAEARIAGRSLINKEPEKTEQQKNEELAKKLISLYR